MKLRRAIALFLKNEVVELFVYARRPDGKKVRYPMATFTAVDKDSSVLGCGSTDYKEKDGNGNVVKKGRVLNQETTLRIDLWVPGEENTSAEERVEELSEAVEHLFEQWRFDPTRSRIVDPATGDDLHVYAIRHISTVDLPLDSSGEPFLARKALTYAITHRRYHERDVEHHMENINLRYGA